MTDQAYNTDLLITLGVPGSGQTRALLKPIETILSDAPRAVREHFLTATKEALRFDAAPIKPTRKPRKPTLASAKKQASKAGIEVNRYEMKPDGTIAVVPGAPTANDAEANPWDEVLIDAADQKRPS